MKFSDDMRFAYPVLSAETGDFTDGHFTLDAFVEEIIQTGQLSIRYNIYLTEPSIRHLVEEGNATVGLFVRCQDTFYSELRALDWPKGKIEFETGSTSTASSASKVADSIASIEKLRRSFRRWHHASTYQFER